MARTRVQPRVVLNRSLSTQEIAKQVVLYDINGNKSIRYRCTLCDIFIQRKEDFSRHLNLHDPHSPRYYCPVPDCTHKTGFPQKSNMLIHVKRHLTPSIPCPHKLEYPDGEIAQCTRNFRTLSALIGHQKDRHGFAQGDDERNISIPTPAKRRSQSKKSQRGLEANHTPSSHTLTVPQNATPPLHPEISPPIFKAVEGWEPAHLGSAPSNVVLLPQILPQDAISTVPFGPNVTDGNWVDQGCFSSTSSNFSVSSYMPSSSSSFQESVTPGTLGLINPHWSANASFPSSQEAMASVSNHSPAFAFPHYAIPSASSSPEAATPEGLWPGFSQAFNVPSLPGPPCAPNDQSLFAYRLNGNLNLGWNMYGACS